MSDRNMQEYLANHPRMIGVLFSMMLLISQSMTAMAGAGGSLKGP